MYSKRAAILISCILTVVSITVLSAAPSESQSNHLQLSANLEGNPPVSHAGFFTLHWKPDVRKGEQRYLLVESRSPDFRDPTVFLFGTDQSIAMSGKPDGDLYYSVFLLAPVQENEPHSIDPSLSSDVDAVLKEYPDYRAVEHSAPFHIRIDHYSLATAFGYFGAGAFLFLITGLVILIGTYRSKEDS